MTFDAWLADPGGILDDDELMAAAAMYDDTDVLDDEGLMAAAAMYDESSTATPADLTAPKAGAEGPQPFTAAVQLAH
jgi:hypothetical protein